MNIEKPYVGMKIKTHKKHKRFAIKGVITNIFEQVYLSKPKKVTYFVENSSNKYDTFVIDENLVTVEPIVIRKKSVHLEFVKDED
jgi:hypothetical protein